MSVGGALPAETAVEPATMEAAAAPETATTETATVEAAALETASAEAPAAHAAAEALHALTVETADLLAIQVRNLACTGIAPAAVLVLLPALRPTSEDLAVAPGIVVVRAGAMLGDVGTRIVAQLGPPGLELAQLGLVQHGSLPSLSCAEM